jgi:hypothetical protein
MISCRADLFKHLKPQNHELHSFDCKMELVFNEDGNGQNESDRDDAYMGILNLVISTHQETVGETMAVFHEVNKAIAPYNAYTTIDREDNRKFFSTPGQNLRQFISSAVNHFSDKLATISTAVVHDNQTDYWAGNTANRVTIWFQVTV